jgi:flagellar biosynthesis protein FlhB
MFYQVPMLIAIALAIVYPESGGDIALAGLMILFSSMFYILMFSAMSGTKIVDLDLEADLNQLWQNRIITISGAVALYAVGMIEVFYYILPFQLIALFCDLLATGFKLGILGMEEVEPEEDDDN